MPCVGEQLQRAREAQDLSLDEIAGSTRIGRAYLEALEEGRYEALPGRAFGKFYIRAYADKLGFDPDPLLRDYEDELRSWQQPDDTREEPEPGRRRIGNAIAAWREGLIAEREKELAAEAGERGALEVDGVDAAETDEDEAAGVLEEIGAPNDTVLAAAEDSAPDEPPHGDFDPVPVSADPVAADLDVAAAVGTAEASTAADTSPADRDAERAQPVPAGVAATIRAPSWLLGLAAAILLAILLLIGSSLTSSNGGDLIVDASTPLVDVDTAIVPLEDDAGTAPADPEPTPAAPQVEPPAENRAPSNLAVTEHGIGRRVVGHRLRDAGTTFTEGDVVAFQTRVTGGRAGDVVRHVWLLDGRVQQSIALRLGSSSFRTHSTKTLWGTGEWVVEARDASGRVLVRDGFRCVAR